MTTLSADQMLPDMPEPQQYLCHHGRFVVAEDRVDVPDHPFRHAYPDNDAAPPPYGGTGSCDDLTPAPWAGFTSPPAP